MAEFARIKLFVPLEERQTIPAEVMDSIKTQSIAVEIIECRSPGITDSQRNSRHYPFEANSRNIAVEKIKQLGKDRACCFMQDSDIVHLKPTNFEDMLEFMEENREWGGVCLPKQNAPITDLEPPHAVIACIYLRHDLWKSMIFRSMNNQCLCRCVSDRVRNAGYRFGYIDRDLGRMKELMNRDGNFPAKPPQVPNRQMGAFHFPPKRAAYFMGTMRNYQSANQNYFHQKLTGSNKSSKSLPLNIVNADIKNMR